MSIRIHFDKIIDFVIQKTGKKGHIYILGAQDSRIKAESYIKKETRYKEYFENLPHSTHIKVNDYFLSKGFSKSTTLDINERADIRLDLNRSIPAQYASSADWVGDFGTLEHIFNVSQGMINVHTLLKPSGIVLHVSPFSYPFHGYFNFNPHFFEEFYHANGYTQIIETYEISLMNPFYTRFTTYLPLFLFRMQLPLEGRFRRLHTLFRYFIARFGVPAYVLYLAAFQKPDSSNVDIKFPYDIWK